MNNKIKKFSILLGLLALMISVAGATAAYAALTLDATSITSDGVITLTSTGDVTVTPTRSASAYSYGFDINPGELFFTGGAAQKSYLFSVRGDRPLASAATGDSNDAGIKVALNNYAANDANFIIRGVNSGINNRSGGTLGILEGGSIGAQNKSGGTSPTVRGLTVAPENFGTVATEFGGIDVVMKNEAAVATTEYGVRIRNVNNSIADAIAAGIVLSDTGVNTGFDFGIDMNGASITTADIRLQNGETIDNTTDGIIAVGGNVLINGAETDATSGYEQFLKVTGNFTGVGTGGSGSKTWALNVDATRAAGANVTVGDSNDMGLKVAVKNQATTNTAGYYMRGLDVAASNRDAGSITSLYGGHISATQKGSSPVTTDLWGLSVKVEADSANTAPTNVIGVNVEYDMVAPTGTPTISAGVRVNQNSDYYSAYPLAGFMVDNGATNKPWQYGLYIDDTTIQTADIRLSNGTNIYSGTAVTRAAVQTATGNNAPIGSIYMGSTAVATTKPNMYVKILDVDDSAANWERVVTQAAD